MLAAPLIPANLDPSGGKYIIAVATNTFTWDAEDQDDYYIEYKENAVGASTSNTGWVTSATSEHEFAANTFTSGTDYLWRIKVRNVASEESSYSEWATFKAGNEPGVNITFPANDFDVVTIYPTYQHQYVNPYDKIQSDFRYRMYTGAKWDDIDAITLAEQEALTWDELELYGGELKYDSGVISGTGTSHYQLPGYYEDGEDYYKVRCNITNNEGTEYRSNLRTYQLNLTDLPPTPTITATVNDDTGAITTAITNPTPGAGQPAASYNRVYRSTNSITFSLLADNVTGDSYADYTCDSGTTYYYKVSAVSDADVEGALSDVDSGVVNLAGYILTDLNNGTSVTIDADPQLKPMTSERDRSEQVGIDETYPVVTYGGRRFWRSGLQGQIFREYEDDDSPAAKLAALREIADAANKKALQLRTPAGEMFMVDVYNFQYTLATANDKARIVSFDFVQVGD